MRGGKITVHSILGNTIRIPTLMLTKIVQILSISFLDDSFPNFNGGSILTGGEIPARVRDALLGVQHGEQLEGVRRPWYEVAEHVRHSVRRYDACFRIPCVAETLHP